MNENGWGLKDVFLFLAIIALALLISMVVYRKTFAQLFSNSGSAFDKESETYYSIEKDLEKSAHTYTDNYYYKILEDGDVGYITIKDLQDKNILKVVKDINDDNVVCSGYVYFKKVGGVTNYKTYLKCGDNYETDGYKDKYDENVKRIKQ